MKNLLIAAALATASLDSQAQVSGIVAVAPVSGLGFFSEGVNFSAQLLDTRSQCDGIGLDALVTTSQRTTIGCWRVIGDRVYLYRMHDARLRDATAPLSAFTGKPFAGIRWGTPVADDNK